MDGLLLGVGNPLLDATIHVDDLYLQKFNLKGGNAILAEKHHLPIYDDVMKKTDAKFGAGGAALNTIRAAQWMLSAPGATTYTGCVGNDKSSEILKTVLANEGVKPIFMETTEAPTGTCAVLVVDKERSLVTNLGAAEKFQLSHFHTKEVIAAIEKAKIYYSTGFFVTVCTESLVEFGKASLAKGKKFFWNLAAPFVISFFWDRVMQVVPYVDVLFCNDNEARVAGEKFSWGTDLEVIAKKLSELPLVEGKKNRTVIITAGADPTCIYFNGKIIRMSPIKISHDQLVDTNGAGDSFVGGFISQYAKFGLEKEISEEEFRKCIDAAHYCAHKIITVVGCHFTGKPDFK
eukprot:TRINITY_DN25695_c0_g1_i1.p1 TRINITY_DN25695_c0_g1~~TRINITY_DN25695_c0_g1_i1.p1  ORF type:complete len:347 (-),score=124.08 TRINITY_DN25695_c0_g1_i1:52-1092(-)